MSNGYSLNRPTGLTCPECGGAVSRVDHGPVPTYVCHIGHSLTGEAMLVAQADRIEQLATGLLAALNERSELCRQLMKFDENTSRRALEQVKDRAKKNAEVVRDLLNSGVF